MQRLHNKPEHRDTQGSPDGLSANAKMILVFLLPNLLLAGTTAGLFYSFPRFMLDLGPKGGGSGPDSLGALGAILFMLWFLLDVVAIILPSLLCCAIATSLRLSSKRQAILVGLSIACATGVTGHFTALLIRNLVFARLS